jgi:hypothetical protein
MWRAWGHDSFIQHFRFKGIYYLGYLGVVTRIFHIHDIGFYVTDLGAEFHFEQGSKPSGSVDSAGMKFVDQLNKYELPKMDPAWN